MNAGPRENGFSLVEALVALLVLGIAAAGLIRATEAHVDSVRALERRTAAAQVAQNRLAELRLSGPAQPARQQVVDMLGAQWVVTERRKATSDPDLVAVTVDVRDRDETSSLATLEGFIGRNAGPK
jgi:general secretion pathway protein I